MCTDCPLHEKTKATSYRRWVCKKKPCIPYIILENNGNCPWGEGRGDGSDLNGMGQIFYFCGDLYALRWQDNSFLFLAKTYVQSIRYLQHNPGNRINQCDLVEVGGKMRPEFVQRDRKLMG